MHYLIKYRSEIDGLRAFAVLPVIFFHAGFSTFQGGFVGVDVFFVISGYLITSIILAEISRDTFSFASFYERRMRRILPALYVVIISTMILAWYFLTPREMQDFSRSVLHAVTFSSNFLFNRTVDYFDRSVEYKPLIHTWSLSVEEQFYILYPILLLALYKISKNRIIFYLLLVLLSSLAAAEFFIHKNPTYAFFLLPTRAWELLIGSLVGIYFHYEHIKKPNKITSEAGSILGFAMVISAIFLFNEKTPNPSLYTLVPTIGTALIILFSTKKTIVGKALGNKYIIPIGLLSYSAYLWHQPLFALARQRSVFELNKPLMMVLVLTTFFLAYITWRFVERPFRNNHRFSRNSIFGFMFVSTFALLIFGYIGKESDGFPYRFNQIERQILNYENYKPPELVESNNECWLDLKNKSNFAENCYKKYLGTPIVIWGDSHAGALYFGMRNYTKLLLKYSYSSCPPVIGSNVSFINDCKENNDWVKNSISIIKPKTVLLHANWTDYEKDIPIDNLKETLNFLKHNISDVKIILIGPVPHFRPSLPELVVQKGANFRTNDKVVNSNQAKFIDYDNQLQQFSNENSIIYVSALNHFCKEDGCTVFMGKNEPILSTWDYGHLTVDGANFLSQEIIKHINNTNRSE